MKILILARMSAYFHGRTIHEKPLGGSESALLYLSRELVARGHQVVIFNNCFSGEGLHDGVEYIHLAKSNRQVLDYAKKRDFDIFISFRDPGALLLPVKAKKKIYWGHDDLSSAWNYPYFLRFAGWLSARFCDKYIVVSNWLARILTEKVGIPAKKIAVIRNGINLSYFEDHDLKRHPYRLIYSSVPERGLDVLKDIFPSIKASLPEAELHIISGKNHKELARELQQSYLWLYPSHAAPRINFYAETSCLAALEAQAAGTPVIASSRGALVESVLNGKTGILIGGDPCSTEFKEKFALETVKLLKDKERWEKMSHAAKEFIRREYPWPKIAREWEEELECLLSQ